MPLLRSFLFFLHGTKKMLLVCSPPEVLPPGSRAATTNPTTRLLSLKRMHTTGAANLSISLYDNNLLPSVLSICFTYLRLEMIQIKNHSPKMGQSKNTEHHQVIDIMKKCEQCSTDKVARTHIDQTCQNLLLRGKCNLSRNNTSCQIK